MKPILACCILCCSLLSNGQLLFEKNFHPGTTTIKGKYYSGTGGKGYWTVQQLDTLGRTTGKSSFKKKRLLEKTIYQYNDKSDLISETVVYDINNPGQQRTTTYEYRYIKDKIVFEKMTSSHQDSTIYRLVKAEGDSILTYQSLSYYATNGKVRPPVEVMYVLTYRNSLLVRKETIRADGGAKEITQLAYDPNGQLNHRIIERIPASELKVIYTGGPGSDDQYYNYQYDQNGRVKTKYTTVFDKCYKLATYRYTR